VIENARLDHLEGRIKRKKKSAGSSLTAERRLIEQRIRRGLKAKAFDTGNGEKVLKRWITLAGRADAKIAPKALEKLIRLRPGIRENVLTFIRSRPLTEARARALAAVATSGWLVDDVAAVDIVNHLVETKITRKYNISGYINDIIVFQNPASYYGFYCRVWLQSKYGSPSDMLNTVRRYRETWLAHDRLGRMVGALRPLFYNAAEGPEYKIEIFRSINTGARETYKFQGQLAADNGIFRAMFDALKNPNPSRGTRITHSKFLCLMSALLNTNAPASLRDKLRINNAEALEDVYYSAIARRLGVA
jgi:hypothetical protein